MCIRDSAPGAPEAPDAPDAFGAPRSSPWAKLFGGGRGATAVISLVAALIAVLVVALGAAHEASGYFLFSPGTAPVITSNSKCEMSGDGELALPDGTPCVRLVLPRGKEHDIDGELMMVDVEVGQAGPIDWLEYKLGPVSYTHLPGPMRPSRAVSSGAVFTSLPLTAVIRSSHFSPARQAGVPAYTASTCTPRESSATL